VNSGTFPPYSIVVKTLLILGLREAGHSEMEEHKINAHSLMPFLCRFLLSGSIWRLQRGLGLKVKQEFAANEKAKLTRKLPTRAVAKAQPKSARKAKAA
jgi:hypothetical protein